MCSFGMAEGYMKCGENSRLMTAESVGESGISVIGRVSSMWETGMEGRRWTERTLFRREALWKSPKRSKGDRRLQRVLADDIHLEDREEMEGWDEERK